ncbi:MAG: hypothetical protein IJ097_03950 [Bacilli bacterium]|nr:hypothetical protein [Bacilli bacterium]
MNNLLKIGISQETLDEMIRVNGLHRVAYLNKDYNIVYHIRDALKQILITDDNINSLLINMIDLFSMDYSKFIFKLKNSNLKEISDNINSDYNYAFDIFLDD